MCKKMPFFSFIWHDLKKTAVMKQLKSVFFTICRCFFTLPSFVSMCRPDAEESPKGKNRRDDQEVACIYGEL